MFDEVLPNPFAYLPTTCSCNLSFMPPNKQPESLAEYLKPSSSDCHFQWEPTLCVVHISLSGKFEKSEQVYKDINTPIATWVFFFPISTSANRFSRNGTMTLCSILFSHYIPLLLSCLPSLALLRNVDCIISTFKNYPC